MYEHSIPHVCTWHGSKLICGFKRLTRFEKGLALQLPEAYKKFWREWKVKEPTPVHYVPKLSRWVRVTETGQVHPVQNVSIPLIFPPESNDGFWGGEGIIKGFQKRHPQKRRVPHFWVPILRRSVVYSKVLNKYMSVVVTDRMLDLIHEHRGFDHYLLSTPACDLQSTLALSIKRCILEVLQGCVSLNSDPDKQKEILTEFGDYLKQYTPEDIEWYGLTFNEALKKLQIKLRAEKKVLPHKIEFRDKFVEGLRLANINAGQTLNMEGMIPSSDGASSSWFSKVNPFSKK